VFCIKIYWISFKQVDFVLDEKNKFLIGFCRQLCANIGPWLRRNMWHVEGGESNVTLSKVYDISNAQALTPRELLE